MRKIIASVQVSIDGVMQGPGSAQEDTSDGFDLGGWSMKFSDATGAGIPWEAWDLIPIKRSTSLLVQEDRVPTELYNKILWEGVKRTPAPATKTQFSKIDADGDGD